MANLNARGFSRAIDSRQRMVHKIHARVNGPGAALLEGDTEVTLVVTGVGDYALSWSGAQRVLSIQCTGEEADTSASAANVTTSGCDVLVTDLAGAAKDAVVSVEITLSDASDKT